MNIRRLLSDRVAEAMRSAGIPEQCTAHVTPSRREGHGDYQANGAMAAAKVVGSNPRDLAQRIVQQLDLGGIADRVEIAGPGFINIFLDAAWLGQQLDRNLGDPLLGVAPLRESETVVVDYSAPNLAKEMHVGHLRSTIIGDAMVRVLEFRGHRVVRQNHMGDWGTQFGMLLAHLQDQLAAHHIAETALSDLERFYREAKQRFDSEPGFSARAREYVVLLQGGDQTCLDLWRQFIAVSIEHSKEIYENLNVSLTPEDIMGESAYNEDLPILVEDLKAKGLAVTDNGAEVVFLEEMADKEGNPSVVIIQKQGGGYLYATTDLAAIRHRVAQLHANRILYFIDARQSLHMQQVFTVARRAGYAGQGVGLEHLPFGTMMGKDGKPFKTREGEVVKLARLLEEAVERATKLVSEKNPTLTAEEQSAVGRAVGIGAVKYADLSKTRTNDYLFDWDSMLSFEGNTAPYLQYAYARIRSLVRKAGISADALQQPIRIEADQERALAIKLIQFSEIIQQLERDSYPHLLCGFLFDIASLYMSYYEACPILKSNVPDATRDSRLRLCLVTARTLKCGLGLLGIKVLERM